MSAFQLCRTSWSSQNLSRRALNVFMVGGATTESGKLVPYWDSPIENY